jgi:hypothetical protein
MFCTCAWYSTGKPESFTASRRNALPVVPMMVVDVGSHPRFWTWPWPGTGVGAAAAASGTVRASAASAARRVWRTRIWGFLSKRGKCR